ncbi:MAG: hypothetical protein WBJ41_04390 [Chromatiaceae bacterium]|jgi:hypothetical protein
MAASLKIFGIILGLLGFGIAYLVPWDHPNFAGYLMTFWIPTVVFYGMGSLISSRDAKYKEHPDDLDAGSGEAGENPGSENIEGRLRRLDKLKENGVISELEWEGRRAEILDEV